MSAAFDQDWQQRYRDKIRTAEQAVGCVADGHRVFVGSGAAVPQTLVEALSANQQLSDVEIVHILTLSPAPYTDPRCGGSFRHNAYFIGPNVRHAVAQGRADYTSIFLHEIPKQFRSGRVVLDAALISVSPPDEYGYCSYGVSCDIVKSAAESARLVVAEVNDRMPRMLGDCFIHTRDIDVMVPSSRELFEARQGNPDETSRRIGRHICTLIEDGCTLQLGIGEIPDAVLHYLDAFRDLGVHTEMFSDGVISLLEKGVITNARKTLHPGKMVTSFVMGSRALYDFVDNNPLIECRPTEYINDPYIVAQNRKMVAINAALEVDLTGQCCADSLGPMFYSGFGGQVDFIRGAARSEGGRPIIAVPSTAMIGNVSRIVPYLKQGAGVVTGRGDVHFVVTEYGVAYLHGKNARERALALIQIAHPDFRPWLISEARSRNLIPSTQIAVSTRRQVYREELERRLELRGDKQAFVRPLKITDESQMRDFLYQLSPATQHDPFFQMHYTSASDRLKRFQEIHYEADLTLTAVTQLNERAELVALAHYTRNHATTFADAAVIVRDDWQHHGLGAALLTTLIDAAVRDGIAGFETTIPADSTRLLRALHSYGYHTETDTRGNAVHLRIPFTRQAPRHPSPRKPQTETTSS